MNKLASFFLAYILSATWGLLAQDISMSSEIRSLLAFPNGPIPALSDVQVKVHMEGMIASVNFYHRYENPSSQDLAFLITLPRLEDKILANLHVYEGTQDYQARIFAPQTTKLLPVSPERLAAVLNSPSDSGKTMVYVQRLAPGKSIELAWTYLERLKSNSGEYSFQLPAIIPQVQSGQNPEITLQEARIPNPYIGARDSARIHIDIQSLGPVQEILSRSHPIQVAYVGSHRAQIKTGYYYTELQKPLELRFRLPENSLLTGARFSPSSPGNTSGLFQVFVQAPPQVERVTPREFIILAEVPPQPSRDVDKQYRDVVVGLLNELASQDYFNVYLYGHDKRVLSDLPRLVTSSVKQNSLNLWKNAAYGTRVDLGESLRDAMLNQSPELRTRHYVVLSAEPTRLLKGLAEQLITAAQHTYLHCLAPQENYFSPELRDLSRSFDFELLALDQVPSLKKVFQAWHDKPDNQLSRFALSAQGMVLEDLYPVTFADLTKKRPIHLIGRYQSTSQDASVRLEGLQGSYHWQNTIAYIPEAPLQYDALAQYWAAQKLAYFEKQKTTFQAPANPQDVLNLALQYQLLNTRIPTELAWAKPKQNDSGIRIFRYNGGPALLLGHTLNSSEQLLRGAPPPQGVDKTQHEGKQILQDRSPQTQVVHIVRDGEYLYKIARHYGVRVEDIRRWNGLDTDQLALDQELRIYPNYQIHRHEVRPGEDLYAIAQLYGVLAQDIRTWNQLNQDALQVGQVLLIYQIQSPE